MRKYLKTGAGNRVLFSFVSFGDLEREESVGVACVRIYIFRITVFTPQIMAVKCSRDSRATTWSQIFVRYLVYTYRRETRMVRDQPPHESDPIAANRGSCRVIPVVSSGQYIT